MARTRRPGRPRASEAPEESARDRILAAASAAFGTHGYDGASVRAIAAAAGVDPALIHHYFGSKSDLFAQVVGSPVQPGRVIARVLDGPRETLGERAMREVLTIWDNPATQRPAAAVLRTAVGNTSATPLLTGFLGTELVKRLARALDGPDAQLRASLAVSHMAGLILARYVLRLRGVADADREELVRLVGPRLQSYFDAPDPGAGIDGPAPAGNNSTHDE